jgi:hypothetical protein
VSNNLQGELPDEIAALRSLAELNLFDNRIGGTIPTALGALANLRLLDVEQNLLTGQAFVDLSGAVAIESYRVSFNTLTGTVPDLGANPSLKEVWAAANRLAGTIPSSVAAMPSLGTLQKTTPLSMHTDLTAHVCVYPHEKSRSSCTTTVFRGACQSYR